MDIIEIYQLARRKLEQLVEAIGCAARFELVVVDFDNGSTPLMYPDRNLSDYLLEAMKMCSSTLLPEFRPFEYEVDDDTVQFISAFEPYEISDVMASDFSSVCKDIKSGKNKSTYVEAMVLVEKKYQNTQKLKVAILIEIIEAEYKNLAQIKCPTIRMSNATTLLDFALEYFFQDERPLNYRIVSEVIQKAGEACIRQIVYNLADANTKWGSGLYSNLHMISHLPYESAAVNGNFIITSRANINQLTMDVRFCKGEEVPIQNHKLVRKLLEITSKDMYLIGTPHEVYGLISKENIDVFLTAKPDQKDFFYHIQLRGVSNWKIHVYGEKIALLVNRAFQYQYEKPRYDPEDLRTALKQVFSSYDFGNLNAIITTAIEQKHGTMVVISGDAAGEAVRLSDCCIRVDPTPLNTMAKYVTAIDGAVLCDPDGLFHAIGVILDGEHTDGNGETIDRGARHNSAKRYYGWNGSPACVIVTISEDGDVVLLPE